MSTRSFIARQNKNGSIDYVYCHWDGYLSYNGFILFTNYHNAEKVNKLFEKKLGFSSLCPDVSEIEFAKDLPMETATDLEEFEKVIEKNWCIEYIYLAIINKHGGVNWKFKKNMKGAQWLEIPDLVAFLDNFDNELTKQLVKQEKETIRIIEG